jgi:uncharacterized protein YbjT (DUF2867 family)
MLRPLLVTKPFLQASGLPSLIVFGGNGFIGTHICQEALKSGLPVTSISRSGRPADDTSSWCNEVTWHIANALYPESYACLLKNALGVVSTIGLVSTSQEDMLRINGEANKTVINAAADAGVGRFALLSAHDYNFPGDLVVLRGYFQGKREAEATLAARFPDTGACSGIYSNCIVMILRAALFLIAASDLPCNCRFCSCRIFPCFRHHGLWALS